MRHRATIDQRRTVANGLGAPARRALRRGVAQAQTTRAAISDLSGSGGGRVQSPPPDPHSSRTPTAPGRPLRVLVVEDEAIIAMEIEMMLQDLGAEVVGIAMTAEEAVRLAETHRPACATMDIRIKGERDGVSAAIEIYDRLGIRSIFVSAFGNDETRARAASARPFAWVKKPFDLDALKSALDRVADDP